MTTPGDTATPYPFPPAIVERVAHLSPAAIDSTPIGQSWESESWEQVSSADSGTWDYREAVECDECGAAVLHSGDHRATLADADGVPVPVADDDGEPITAASDDERDEWADLIEAHDDDEAGPYTWRECERHDDDAREMYAEGPMMNYYYPVDLGDLDAAARTLAGTCLCAVEVDGVTGLALTGGGMDLSWEIAAAFVALGYLPPVHFAHLPGMAGMTASDRNLTTAAAMLRSCEVMAMRQARAVDHLTGYILPGLRPVEVDA